MSAAPEGRPRAPRASSTALRAEVVQAPLRHAQEVEVALGVDRAWALFSDTDLMNRALGLPLVRVERIPVRPGLALLQVEQVDGLPFRYEEEHCEWEEGSWFAVRRRFLDGPVAKVVLFFDLEACGGAASRLTLQVAVWPRSEEHRAEAEFLVAELLPESAAFSAAARKALDSSPTPDGPVQVALESGEVLEAERVLYTLGRVANRPLPASAPDGFAARIRQQGCSRAPPSELASWRRPQPRTHHPGRRLRSGPLLDLSERGNFLLL